jgi:tetratricopeptide (TPR) repeat protein
VDYNLDLSGYLNPVDKFSVQAKFDLGDFGRAKRQKDVDEMYLLGVREYANGNYEKAIGYWKKVLEMDPEYLPARENIDTVQKALDLQSQMESRGE